MCSYPTCIDVLSNTISMYFCLISSVKSRKSLKPHQRELCVCMYTLFTLSHYFFPFQFWKREKEKVGAKPYSSVWTAELIEVGYKRKWLKQKEKLLQTRDMILKDWFASLHVFLFNKIIVFLFNRKSLFSYLTENFI